MCSTSSYVEKKIPARAIHDFCYPGMLMGAKRFTKTGSFNSTAARRVLAKEMIAAGKLPYCDIPRLLRE